MCAWMWARASTPRLILARCGLLLTRQCCCPAVAPLLLHLCCFAAVQVRAGYMVLICESSHFPLPLTCRWRAGLCRAWAGAASRSSCGETSSTPGCAPASCSPGGRAHTRWVGVGVAGGCGAGWLFLISWRHMPCLPDLPLPLAPSLPPPPVQLLAALAALTSPAATTCRPAAHYLAPCRAAALPLKTLRLLCCRTPCGPADPHGQRHPRGLPGHPAAQRPLRAHPHGAQQQGGGGAPLLPG